MALALIELFPRRPYAHATGEADLIMSTKELHKVIRKALPEARYRAVREPWKIKKPLLQAILRLRAKNALPAPAAKKADAPVFWSSGEWLAFATHLHILHPQHDFVRAPHFGALTLAQVNAAAAAMPEGRRRKFAALVTVVPKLRPIYDRMLARHGEDYLKPDLPPGQLALLVAPSTPSKLDRAVDAPRPRGAAGVRWTEAEWDTMATTLLARYPQYATDATLGCLQTRDLIAAQDALPEDRRRSYASLSVFKFVKAPLAAAIDRLQARARGETVVASTTPPENPQIGVTKIFWSKDEWLQVARELCRLKPQVDYLSITGLNAVHGTDLQAAQLVLPPQRQRPKSTMAHIMGARPHLEKAFHRIREDLQRQAGVPHALAEPVAAPDPVVEPAVEPAVDVAPAAPVVPAVSAVVAAPAVAAAAPGVNPWEAAFRPLVEGLAAQLTSGLVSALAPALTQAITAQLTQQIAPMIDTAMAQMTDSAMAQMAEKLKPAAPPRDYPFLPPQKPAEEVKAAPAPAAPIAAKVAAEQPKPVVGVVGPLPAQQRALEAAYPNLELRFVEKNANGNAVASLQSCVRVIGMTSFMNHPTDGALRRHFGPRYCRVTGGVSAIKHQIDVLIKTGDINERRAAGR